MIRIIIFTFIILVFHSSVFSEEIRLLPGETLPELRDIKVQANVSYESATNIYTYNYIVTNSNTSTGAIEHMEIDITKPEGSISLSKESLRYGKGYLRFGSERLFERFGSLVIRVGTSAPSDWITGITVRKTISWGAVREASFIYPNSSTEGFELNSRGLPGIRHFTTSPYFKQQPVEEATEEDVERLKAIEERIIFKTKTVGPTAPPADFKPISFLNYIISLKHESYKLGWIVQGRDDDKDKYEDEEEGIMKSLDKKLEKAKAELVKGDTKEAIEKLKSFIHEVEALYKEDKEEKHKKEEEGHSRITSEAYALLKYNTIYLIEKLGGEWKDKNNKKD